MADKNPLMKLASSVLNWGSRSSSRSSVKSRSSRSRSASRKRRGSAAKKIQRTFRAKRSALRTRHQASAAKKIQGLFRAKRSTLKAKNMKSLRSSIRTAKARGRAIRKAMTAPIRDAEGWYYDNLRARQKPEDGSMRWKLLPGQEDKKLADKIPNEDSFEMFVEGKAGGAGHWTKAYDPMGDYGGPFSNSRKLAENPRWAEQQEEGRKYVAEMEGQKRRARLETAGEGPIPEKVKQEIAVRVAKIAKTRAEAAAKAAGKTKKQYSEEVQAEYKATYDQVLEYLGEPGVRLANVEAVAAQMEANAGITMTAAEARRAAKKVE